MLTSFWIIVSVKNMHIYVSFKKYACFVIIWLNVRAYRLNVEFFYDSKVFILTEYEKSLYNLSRSDMWLLYYQECYCRHVYFHCYCIFEHPHLLVLL